MVDLLLEGGGKAVTMFLSVQLVEPLGLFKGQLKTRFIITKEALCNLHEFAGIRKVLPTTASQKMGNAFQFFLRLPNTERNVFWHMFI